MSLTWHIKNKTEVYDALLSAVDVERCNDLIRHQSTRLSRLIHRPASGTDFPLTGMSIIYAVRDYIGGAKLWKDTVAATRYPYPSNIATPTRWVAMGMMDAAARTGVAQGLTVRGLKESGSFPPALRATVEDVNAIASSIPSVLGNVSREGIHVNPTFEGSSFVGGADANMIIGDTLWDIRTTARRSPLDLDTILQQVGYYLLDYRDEYGIKKISWYYTRQQCYFTHSIDLLIKPEARQDFEYFLDERPSNAFAWDDYF